MNIMLTRTTTIPWSPSPPRAASSSTTRRSRNAWAVPPWLPSLAPWMEWELRPWMGPPVRNVAFSCLKKVAEFYGLWYNELVNGVYKPTYNSGAPSCIEMEVFIAGNINEWWIFHRFLSWVIWWTLSQWEIQTMWGLNGECHLVI